MTIFIIIFAAAILFLVYFLIDMFFAKNLNNFFDKWLEKSIWIWLPFVAFWRLVKELILKKK